MPFFFSSKTLILKSKANKIIISFVIIIILSPYNFDDMKTHYYIKVFIDLIENFGIEKVSMLYHFDTLYKKAKCYFMLFSLLFFSTIYFVFVFSSNLLYFSLLFCFFIFSILFLQINHAIKTSLTRVAPGTTQPSPYLEGHSYCMNSSLPTIRCQQP